MTAIEQLDYWLMFQRHWCEHKPSVTISVKEDEWMEVGAWVYKNFDEVSGISFLPFSEHTYKQAPYQDIDENEYKELMKTMPKAIDWSKLKDFEKEDTTNGSKELACTAGVCEVVDIEAS
jgi:ribonucleoside-diphosphate reductase alpha chain